MVSIFQFTSNEQTLQEGEIELGQQAFIFPITSTYPWSDLGPKSKILRITFEKKV